MLNNSGQGLEAQINRPGVGLGTNWVSVTGSTVTNQLRMTLGAGDGSVFYRLVYP